MLTHLTRLAQSRCGQAPAAAGGANGALGIYSICSAHPLVIEAAMHQALDDGTPLLVEATANQVNQFGGYTGMQPADFRRFVLAIADRCGLPQDRVLLGGDHLGPTAWTHLPAAEAMDLAQDLVHAYAAAGFVKLHLDASMACAGDPQALDDATVARRAALLCQAAEQASTCPAPGPAYVIGTEVPVPGGAAHALEHVEVTARADAQRTLQVHRDVFAQQGLDAVWPRIIALVVQPGVEFDHTRVVDYAPAGAADLRQLLRQHPQLVFEAHSTDYQRPEALRQLVQDGFAILKVGPGATFALREALFALAAIEEQLVDAPQRSHLPAVLESAMLGRPANWERYYRGEQPDPGAQRLLRIYSYSDRIRYYWADPTVNAAVVRLLDNLSACTLPENMLSQFLPAQYQAVRAGRLAPSPHALVLDRVREAIRPYAAACNASLTAVPPPP
ncbi:tagatose-bisphosphate aldolase [Delftia tsuruhatensis]|jgi:D-tagatose-1,6-bisphosphate aldolase subunit GatZ/KbaZ|uniref:D-tagatose-bisphosphate aldolase, class II, non-catalytic subunit n=1 Tax=uncultured Delftia sp. TaxID=191464 RepID=UPI0004D86C8E|nr:D-tagatose-bisphosphate aldolase, class II, non-catalytic subunit [uncultured Delftia sp.]KEH08245.1 tagatose-bisphosphate aldolase [Delftia tsuruhatensis]